MRSGECHTKNAAQVYFNSLKNFQPSGTLVQFNQS
jgi:hypothetical protein